MTTVQDLRRWAAATLRASGISTPALDSDVLLAHALGISRTEMLARLTEEVSADHEEDFGAIIARRLAREPVAYIVGHREFFGLDLEVNNFVLVPRPETELLLQLALDMSGDTGVAVDVGTGSGGLAVGFALHRPGWRVWVTDVSQEALEVARRNAARLGVADQITFRQGSLLEPVAEQVDLLMANLPYLSELELDELDPEVRLWEPRLALTAENEGIGLIRNLIQELPGKLQADAVCLLEIDPRQAEQVARIVHDVFPGAELRVHQDLARRDRVVEIRPFTPS